MGMFDELRAAYTIYANEVNFYGLYSDTFQNETVQKFGKYMDALKELEAFYERNKALLPESPESPDGRRFLKNLTTVGDAAFNTQINNLPEDEAADLLKEKTTAEDSLFSDVMLFYDDAAKLMKAKNGGFDAEDMKCLSLVGELYDAFGFEKIGDTPVQGTGMTPKQQYSASVENRGQVVDNLRANQEKAPKDAQTEEEWYRESCERMFQNYGVYQQRNRELEDRLEEKRKAEEKRRKEQEDQRRREEEERDAARKLAEQEEARKREEERKKEEARKNLPLRTDVLYEIAYQGRDVVTQLNMENIPIPERKETGRRLYGIFTAAWDVIKRITARFTGGRTELLTGTMQQIDDYVQNKTEQELNPFEANRKLEAGMKEFLSDAPKELLFENEDDFRALKQMNDFITFNNNPGKRLDEEKKWYEINKADASRQRESDPSNEPQEGEGQIDAQADGPQNVENNKGDYSVVEEENGEGYSFVEEENDGRYSEVDDLLFKQFEPVNKAGGETLDNANGGGKKEGGEPEGEEPNGEKQDGLEQGRSSVFGEPDKEELNKEELNKEELNGEEPNAEKQDGAEQRRSSASGEKLDADREEINTNIKEGELPKLDPLPPEKDENGVEKTAAQYARDLRAYLEKIKRDYRFDILRKEIAENEGLLRGAGQAVEVDFGKQMPLTAAITKLMIVEQNLRVGEKMEDVEREFRETLPVTQLYLDEQLKSALRGGMAEEFLAEASPEYSQLYAAAADAEPGGLMKALDWAMNSDPYRALGKLIDVGVTSEARRDEVQKRFRVLGSIHTLLTVKRYNAEVLKPFLGAGDPAEKEYENVCSELRKLAAPHNESGRDKEIALGQETILNAKKVMADYLKKNAASTAEHLRERFDRVMCAYGCLCRTDEFKDFCDGINGLRKAQNLLKQNAEPSDVHYAAPQDYAAERYIDYNATRRTAKQLVAKANAMSGKDLVKRAAMKCAAYALSVKDGRLNPHTLLSVREMKDVSNKLLESQSFCASVGNKTDAQLLQAARVVLNPSLAPKTRVETKDVTVSRLVDVDAYLKKLDEDMGPEIDRLKDAKDLDNRKRCDDLSEQVLIKAATARWMATREYSGGGIGKVDPKRIDYYADYLLNHYRKTPSGDMDIEKGGILLNVMKQGNEVDKIRFFDDMNSKMAEYAGKKGLAPDNTADVERETKTITTGAALIQPTFGL